jgi:hypothetical protein
MARIRTVKPEFWSDSKIIECSLNARLLFIGALNFSDDEGNLDRSSRQLKAQVLPADDVDCEPLIKEMIENFLCTEYSVNGKKYLHINNFKKHQIINRPGKPKYPLYFSDNSLNIHGVITDHSSLEGKGREEEGSKPPSQGQEVTMEIGEKTIDDETGKIKWTA